MDKIKSFIDSEKGKDILTIVIVILVGLGAFELGRLSKAGDSSGITIEYTDQAGNMSASAISAVSSIKKVPTETSSAGKNFFASSRGTKYYSLGCSAGNSIKLENRVYFETKEKAEGSGYELSTSCK